MLWLLARHTGEGRLPLRLRLLLVLVLMLMMLLCHGACLS